MNEIGQEYIQKFKVAKVKKISESQALAGEIYEHFGKRIPFPRLMKMIQTKGVIFNRETFEQVKKSKAKDELALFISIVSKQNIVWK